MKFAYGEKNRNINAKELFSLTSLIESSEWKSEADLTQAYLESMKFAYGEKNRNINAKELFNFMLSHVDIVARRIN
ncbi:MAG: hypothetical protein B6U95_08895 [Thermofilum sp. ex4484_82]|nr:MAG: hypothetical protein B6U95_08895 [Thermofilum sp. ex4484_82]OYT36115.1 MAG: hypothetical protein B6U96_08900 [Archaeoglobales archaeon ex4484_92]